MHIYFFFCCTVLLLIGLNFVESKKNPRAYKRVDDNLEEEEEEVLKYTYKSELNKKFEELKLKKAEELKMKKEKFSPDDNLTLKDKEKLKKVEVSLQREVEKSELNFGAMSRERAKALHLLGGNIYKQRRYKELLELSKEIVRIHENLDGPEDENTAKALGNLGSVAYRIGDSIECELAMNRAMYILQRKYGPESKEVLLHRGKMLTFKVPFAETTVGISHEEYLDEL